MPYPETFVGPMREELARLGVEELRTAAAVDDAVKTTEFLRTTGAMDVFEVEDD